MATASRHRPRTNRKSYAESDEENCGTMNTDADWSPEDDEIVDPSTSSNDTSLPEDEEFNSTDGFTLKVIKNVKQSHHVIWKRYGLLMKNGKIVDRVKDRIYCIACLEKKKFKR